MVNLLNVSATILFGGVNDIGAGATAAFADDQVYPDLVRRRVNECLRASKPFDAVFDSGAVVRDPAYLSRIRPDLEAPGHIHLNLEGYEAVAAIIPLPALASAKPKSRAFRRGRRRSMGA